MECNANFAHKTGVGVGAEREAGGGGEAGEGFM